mmetsp:Transcript_9228/g.28460  ORF Transcript_9228/g.28460 Transcript_9228/m.28460 type:complete len:413 (+) Transcript_9228:67-1305(+)
MASTPDSTGDGSSGSQGKSEAAGSWFARLFGAEEVRGEGGFEATQALFAVEPCTDAEEELVATATGRRFRVGRFETPSLAQLREREAAYDGPDVSGSLELVNDIGEAREIHTQLEAASAVFQVASQFNCLEFVHSGMTPEDGVTQYEHDHTQGPACALACAASTVWRNYFAFVGENGVALPPGAEGSACKPRGQRAKRQINNFAGVQELLGGGLLEVRNGYSFCGPGVRVEDIAARVDGMTEEERDALRAALRVGVQWGAEVTDPRREYKKNSETKRWETVATPCGAVTQVFCSALAVQSSTKLRLWQPMAQLVLDASYEATLAVGKHNLRHGGSRDVYLTLLGGGNFGNGPEWIKQAIVRALQLYKNSGLRVHVVHRSELAPWMGAYRLLAAEWGGGALPSEEEERSAATP